VVLAVRLPVDWLPLVVFAPVQPPLAVQPVALVEVQLIVVDVPLKIDAAVVLIVTVGTGVVQLSPGLPLLKSLLGTQVLSDLRRITLSTFTPAFKPYILALMLPVVSCEVTSGVVLAVAS
jgi:hypothetical protein